MTTEPGLCSDCTWAIPVPTTRGAAFLRCARSQDDQAFARYPQLPVRVCPGYAPSEPNSELPSEGDAAHGTPSPPPQLISVGSVREQRTLFDRVGGRDTVEAVIDALYDRIETDPDLRPLFPSDLSAGRLHQQLFFEQWLGGEARYNERRGSPRLRQRHLQFPIDRQSVDRWLTHMSAALAFCGVDAETAGEIMEALEPLALHFINRPPSQSLD